MISKYKLPKILAVIITAVILSTFAFSGQVQSWSAVVGNRTHKDIADAAYEILSQDPASKNIKFPALTTIENYDWVEPVYRTGPGPDVLGSSNASAHFYNPRLEAIQPKAGGGPDAVKLEFTNLVDALKTGKSTAAAKAASWAAHYIADLNMPYHTQGTYRADIMKIYDAAGGRNATTVPLPSYITGPMGLSTSIKDHPNDFKKEIVAFIAGTANHTATEDWFDPWYWDGRVNAMVFSSHVVFEGETFAMPGSWTSLILDWDLSGGVKGYSSRWSNLTPSFDNVAEKQAAKIREFARNMALVAQRATDGMEGRVSVATPFLQDAIESAATVWRASFSALVPTVNIGVPDKTKPQKLKVTGWVTNWAGETVNNVQLKLTVTGGTLKSGEAMPKLDELYPGKQQSWTWDVEASNLGYCTVQMEVIGSYKDTPDMQYAVTKISMPGIIPVTSKTGSFTRAHSIVFCLDNSDSMKGQPIIDAMNAGVQAVNAAGSGLVEMAVIFFGVNGCDPPIRVVDFTVDRDSIKSAIQTASAKGNTPLAAAITAAGDYIKSKAQGQEATIILLTDGMETCNGDPVAAAKALNPGLNIKIKTGLFTKPLYAATNIPIKLQVVGFNVGQATAAETVLKQIAQAGNGNYVSAANKQELVKALTTAVKEATNQGIQIQTWWFIVGGAVLLLFVILMARRGKRPQVPATVTAGASAIAPPPMARQPGVSPPLSTPFCPNCGSRVQTGAAFCTGCGRPLAFAAPSLTTPAAPSQTYCTRCGALNAPGSAFCYKCGNSLTMNLPYSTPAVMPPQGQTCCPQCGTPNPAGSTFCNKCGAAMQPEAKPPQATVSQKTVKKVSAGWWLIAIFLLLPGGLIAWAIVKKDNPHTAGRLLMVSLFVTALVFYGIVQNIVN